MDIYNCDHLLFSIVIHPESITSVCDVCGLVASEPGPDQSK